MGTGIWANFHWESGIWVTGTGIWSLGMGITDRKTIELGLGFFKFGKTIGWEMGFIPPFQDPLNKPKESPEVGQQLQQKEKKEE